MLGVLDGRGRDETRNIKQTVTPTSRLRCAYAHVPRPVHHRRHLFSSRAPERPAVTHTPSFPSFSRVLLLLTVGSRPGPAAARSATANRMVSRTASDEMMGRSLGRRMSMSRIRCKTERDEAVRCAQRGYGVTGGQNKSIETITLIKTTTAARACERASVCILQMCHAPTNYY